MSAAAGFQSRDIGQRGITSPQRFNSPRAKMLDRFATMVDSELQVEEVMATWIVVPKDIGQPGQRPPPIFKPAPRTSANMRLHRFTTFVDRAYTTASETIHSRDIGEPSETSAISFHPKAFAESASPSSHKIESEGIDEFASYRVIPNRRDHVDHTVGFGLPTVSSRDIGQPSGTKPPTFIPRNIGQPGNHEPSTFKPPVHSGALVVH